MHGGDTVEMRSRVLPGSIATIGIATELHAAMNGLPDLLRVQAGADKADAFPLEQRGKLGAATCNRENR